MRKIWIVPFILIIASCSKQSTATYNACDNIEAVLLNSPYSNDTEAVFTYDNMGRVKSYYQGVVDSVTYNYYSDHIDMTEKSVYGGNGTSRYDLDNMQRVIGANGDDSLFKYNGDGYLSSYRQYYGYTELIITPLII